MMNLPRRTRFLSLLALGALLARGVSLPLSLYAEPAEGMKKDAHAKHERAAHDFAGHVLRSLQQERRGNNGSPRHLMMFTDIPSTLSWA